MLRLGLAQSQGQWMEHFRHHSLDRQFCDYPCRSIWKRRFRFSTIAETLPCQYRLQAGRKNKQSEYAVQNCDVRSFLFISNFILIFLDPSSSLPSILSLLGLWVVLFIFFAILFVEVFGLTKWGANETHTINYYTLGNALLMLSFQSTGYVKC